MIASYNGEILSIGRDCWRCDLSTRRFSVDVANGDVPLLLQRPLNSYLWKSKYQEFNRIKVKLFACNHTVVFTQQDSGYWTWVVYNRVCCFMQHTQHRTFEESEENFRFILTDKPVDQHKNWALYVRGGDYGLLEVVGNKLNISGRRFDKLTYDSITKAKLKIFELLDLEPDVKLLG